MGLSIELFGAPAVIAGGERYEHRSRKAMALLAYLAMRADEHISRAHLAGLLWGDSAEEQARANLRQTLSQLRGLLRDAGHDPIMAPFDKIVLVSEGVEIDARRALEGAADVAHLPEFLEGLATGAPEFETWVTAQRAMIRARALAALTGEAEAATKACDHARAAERLAAALKLDPLQESAHRRLMAALAALGRTDEALAQFESCRAQLKAELGIEPEAETRRLAAELRARRLKPAAAAPFQRVSDAAPAVLFRATGGAPEALGRYPDARAALEEALRVARRADDGAALAVAPDAGDAAMATQSLIAATPQGGIAVDERIYELFRHWSPFAFEPAEAGYRLVSELPRNRFQGVPAVETPEAKAAADFSVAVLPLLDRSPDAAEFALGDVLQEEITHRLSRFRNLTVAAPSAGQTFRARKLPHDEARRRLGVNYLIDGGVFRAGDRLRANLTLTDLRDDRLVFSDHFDGAFSQLFEHQNALIDRIATAMFRRAEDAEMRRAARAPTADFGAYEWYLRGLAAHRRAGISPDNARRAFDHFTRAIEIDNDFARALAWRICAVGWYAPEYYWDPGWAEAHRALAIDENDAEVRRIVGALHLYRGEHDDALLHMSRAIELNPSDAYLLAGTGVYFAFSGQPEIGLGHIERAMALDPFLPTWLVEDHGVVLYTMEDYAGAAASLKLMSYPTPRGLSFLAASQVAGGDEAGAARTVARIRALSRDYSIGELMLTIHYRRPEENARLEGLLRRAGLA